MRLTDQRLAAAVPPAMAVLAGAAPVAVRLVVVAADGSRVESRATATVVRSGRAWTEARGRLREERGWARRFAKAPAEVVLLSPVDDD